MPLTVYGKYLKIPQAGLQAGETMRFGDRVRELRKKKGLGQRALAQLVGISFTYVSKIENHHLDFGDYPSDSLIHKLADALDAEEDELMILAERIPDQIRRRFMARPDAFRKLAELDDKTLDWLVGQIKRRPASV